MTDQFTSLPLTALKDIIVHIDESISLIEKHKGRITVSDIQVKSMLSAVRRQLLEHVREREEEKP